MAFDSSIFNHPVAQKTKWKPNTRGGSNVTPRALKEESSSRLIFKGSYYALIIGAGFLIVPSIFIIFLIGDLKGAQYLFLLIPFLFQLVGLSGSYSIYKPIIIDKDFGYLYRSYKRYKVNSNITPDKKWIALDQVVAIQILSENVKNQKKSFKSYEINFVLKDAGRFTVVDHSDLTIIEKDAVKISNLLEIPIWNIITGETIHPKDPSYTDGISHYDSKNQYDESYKQYDSYKNYDNSSENDHSQEEEDLDKPYNSLKKRKL